MLNTHLPDCKLALVDVLSYKFGAVFNVRLLTGYHYSEATVVEDDNLITSRGPGTAFEFALTLVEKLCGSEKRSEVAGPMLLK